MTYIKINPKTKAKDLKALPGLAATLGRTTDVETKRADEAFAAMPAKLTAGQQRFLREDARSYRATARMTATRLRESARAFEQIAKRGKLTAAERRWLRVTLANINSLVFAKL